VHRVGAESDRRYLESSTISIVDLLAITVLVISLQADSTNRALCPYWFCRPSVAVNEPVVGLRLHCQQKAALQMQWRLFRFLVPGPESNDSWKRMYVDV